MRGEKVGVKGEILSHRETVEKVIERGGELP